MFDFYPGLPHIRSKLERTVYKVSVKGIKLSAGRILFSNTHMLYREYCILPGKSWTVSFSWEAHNH